MKEKLKKITQSKIFIIVLLIVLIGLIIGVGTYAWFTWTSTNNTSLTLSIGNLTDVTFDKGPNININNLAPVFNYTDGVSTTFSINNRDTSGTPATYTVKLNISHIDNELISSDFKFTLLEGTNIVSEGDFSTASDGGILNIGSGSIKSGVTNYTIYFYIDSNNENNPNMMNKNLTGTIEVSGVDESSSPSYITLTNLGLSIDTAHTPDFTTCSGNSCIYYDNSTGDETSGHGDSTNGIYSAKDDLGTSYYFRGAANNNYVSFAGKTWRIVRINGDGTVRIALNGSAGTSAFNSSYNDNTYVGYMYGTPGSSTYAATHENAHNSTIKTFLDDWYDTNLSSYSSYIADSIFCNDRSLSNVSDYLDETATNTGIGTAVTAYSGYKRTFVDHNPSLICPQNNDKFTVSSSLGNGALTKAIGLLTADEYLMAGAGPLDINTNSLYNYNSSVGAFYLYDNSNLYWSMSPNGYVWGNSLASYVGRVGNVDGNFVNFNYFAVRPAVSLKSDAITGGTGTSSDPFTVSGSSSGGGASTGDTNKEFNYTGGEQTFTAPRAGTYKLEVWGAQGGSYNETYYGGYGGYSVGNISLTSGEKLYIYVGGAGSLSNSAYSGIVAAQGGYNGGGAALARNDVAACSGGGATHIAKRSGLLSTLSSSSADIIIVAGGGGGASAYTGTTSGWGGWGGSSNRTGSAGGSGGGFEGVVPTNTCTDCGTRSGGSQTSGGVSRFGTASFGQGLGSTTQATCGGGGGYYGGSGDTYEWGATGGSGYLKSTLSNKSMYCYNCTASNDTNTKTVSVTNTSETATANYAKKGNGYAKITFVS